MNRQKEAPRCSGVIFSHLHSEAEIPLSRASPPQLPLTINYFLSRREALFLSLRPLTRLPWLAPPEYIAWLSSIFIKRRRKLNSYEQEGERVGCIGKMSFLPLGGKKYPPSLQAELRGLPQPLLKLNYFSGAIRRQHKRVGMVSTDSWAERAPRSSGLHQSTEGLPGAPHHYLHRMTGFYLKLDSRKDLPGIEYLKRKPFSSFFLLPLGMSKNASSSQGR